MVLRVCPYHTIKKIIVLSYYRTLDLVMSTTISLPVRRPSSYYFRGCPKPITELLSAVGQESAIKNLHQERESYGEKFINGGEDALGLRMGRSSRCVSVDRTGRVGGNSIGGYESGGCQIR